MARGCAAKHATSASAARTIDTVSALTVREAQEFFGNLQLE